MKIKNKILIVFIATLAGTIIWIVSIFLAPYLRAQSVYWSRIIYVAFSPICHQIPARCFIFYGYPLAVCTRCLGIYFGFFVGTLFYPLFRGFASITLPEKKIFILMSLPIVVDTIGNLFALWVTPPWIRYATGFLWGIMLPFYFITGIADALISRANK